MGVKMMSEKSLKSVVDVVGKEKPFKNEYTQGFYDALYMVLHDSEVDK